MEYVKSCSQQLKNTFFLITHGTLIKSDHLPGHKGSFNNWQRFSISETVVFGHNGTKVEIANRKSTAQTKQTKQTKLCLELLKSTPGKLVSQRKNNTES